MSVSGLLILLAVICFALACFGVSLPIALVPLGLALQAASFLV